MAEDLKQSDSTPGATIPADTGKHPPFVMVTLKETGLEISTNVSDGFSAVGLLQAGISVIVQKILAPKNSAPLIAKPNGFMKRVFGR